MTQTVGLSALSSKLWFKFIKYSIQKSTEFLLFYESIITKSDLQLINIFHMKIAKECYL